MPRPPHGFPRFLGFDSKTVQRCKGVHFIDLGESFPTSIYLQNLASTQPRTSLVKFARSPRTDRPGTCTNCRNQPFALRPKRQIPGHFFGSTNVSEGAAHQCTAKCSSGCTAHRKGMKIGHHAARGIIAGKVGSLARSVLALA